MNKFLANIPTILLAAAFLWGISIEPAAAQRTTAAQRTAAAKSFNHRTAAIEVARRVNLHRKRLGLPTLKYDKRLANAALLHSTDMKKHGFFSHNSPVSAHRTFFIRANLFGTRASGENIAKGPDGPGGVVAVWMKSTGHRKVMLNPKIRRIGVGKHGSRWTLLVGR